jgi:predicted molibdopterin-dependent oxidoreductase YjgC
MLHAAGAGLKILTTTPEIREIRRIAVELLLANHDQSCPPARAAPTASCRVWRSGWA